MGQIISLSEYREKKQKEDNYVAKYRKLNSDLDKSRKKLYIKSAKRPRVKELRARHNYDMYFINLLDLFMEKNYPEYQWRFSLFLKDMEEKSEEMEQKDD